MSEANGTVLIRATPDLLALIDLEGDSLTLDAMRSLFASAAISPADAEALLVEAIRLDDGFPHEGIEQAHGFLVITTFGDEWMAPLQHLVEHGNGVEVYGRIDHEYGYCELYALDGRGARHFGTIDCEGDHDEDVAAETTNEWLSRVPAATRAAFPDLFVPETTESHEETPADETDAPAERWRPVSDDDHVVEIRGVLQVRGDLLNAELYRRESLERAIALGGQLVYPRGEDQPPMSELHYILSSLQHNVASKIEITSHMLDLHERGTYRFDLDQVCKGYGEQRSTALSLAAGNGLLPIVERLLALGADPMIDGDECALHAASWALRIRPALDAEHEAFDEDERNEGTTKDLRAIVALLEARR